MSLNVISDVTRVESVLTHDRALATSRSAGYTDRLMSFSDGDVAERLRGKLVSWTYFSLLGLRPANGRDFAEADGRLEREPVGRPHQERRRTRSDRERISALPRAA